MQRKGSLIASLLCLVVVLVSLVGHQAEASPVSSQLSPFGVEINREQVERTGNRVQRAGIDWVRYNAILWSEVEPVPGMRNWAALSAVEADFARLQAQGAAVVVVVRGTPTWAQQLPGTHCGPIRVEALNAFATFLHDLALRYSQPPYNIHYWEIWNEPDVDPALIPGFYPFGCWGNAADPSYGGRYYAEMLKRAYPAIKQANPQAQVIMGGLMLDCDSTRELSNLYLPLLAQAENATTTATITATTPLVAALPAPPPAPPKNHLIAPEQGNVPCVAGRFLEGVLQQGGGNAFDILAYHSYAFWDEHQHDWEQNYPPWSHRGGALLGRLDFLRTTLQQYGVQKPILLNEGSLLCRNSDPACFAGDFLDDQANYVVRFYTRAWANGLLGAAWYTLNDPDWNESGMMTASGESRPAYETLRFMANLLEGARYTGQLSSGTLEGYAFRSGETDYHVYWTNDGSVVDVTVAGASWTSYHKSGKLLHARRAPGDGIQVGFDPVFVEVHP